MVELKEATIEAIEKIHSAIKDTKFYLNRFSVTDSGTGKQIIEFDIREKEDG